MLRLGSSFGCTPELRWYFVGLAWLSLAVMKFKVLYCSVTLHGEEELKALKDRMSLSNLQTLDMTNNDLAKDHLRHLVRHSKQKGM